MPCVYADTRPVAEILGLGIGLPAGGVNASILELVVSLAWLCREQRWDVNVLRRFTVLHYPPNLLRFCVKQVFGVLDEDLLQRNALLLNPIKYRFKVRSYVKAVISSVRPVCCKYAPIRP